MAVRRYTAGRCNKTVTLLLICFNVCVSLIILICFHYHLTVEFENDRLKIEQGQQQSSISAPVNRLKIILYWNVFFNASDFNLGFGRQPLIEAKCQVNNCIFTDDIDKFNESDVVIFFAQFIYDLPNHRFPNQRFVFYQMESTVHSYAKPLKDMRIRYNYFNWTMTHRLDSDIVQRDIYGAIVPKANAHLPDIYPESLYSMNDGGGGRSRRQTKPSPLYLRRPKSDSDVWRGKTKLVAWFASHCPTPIRREEYVRQLSQYVQVDVYGKCGNMTTCGNDEKCLQMLRTDYKFYLSFENSWCPDYVTEKFYRPLLYDTVPIVLGGVDYDQFAPPHSYINAFDFPSAKELAEYLHLLDRNEDLYARYFDWKRHYEVALPANDGWCDLCKMANDANQPIKVYPDIQQWWMDQGKCESNWSQYF